MPTMSPVRGGETMVVEEDEEEKEGDGGNGGGRGEKEDEEKKNVPNEMAGGNMRGRRCGDSNNS